MARPKSTAEDRQYRYQDKLYGQLDYGLIELEDGELPPIQCNDTVSFRGKYYSPGWAVTDRRLWSIERALWLVPGDDGKKVPMYWMYKGEIHCTASSIIANYRCDKSVIYLAGRKALHDKGVEDPTDDQVRKAGEALVEVHHIRAYGPLPKELLEAEGTGPARRRDSMVRDRAANLQYILQVDHSKFISPLSHWRSAGYDLASGKDSEIKYVMDAGDGCYDPLNKLARGQAGYEIRYHEDGTKEFHIICEVPDGGATERTRQIKYDPDRGLLIDEVTGETRSLRDVGVWRL